MFLAALTFGGDANFNLYRCSMMRNRTGDQLWRTYRTHLRYFAFKARGQVGGWMNGWIDEVSALNILDTC